MKISIKIIYLLLFTCAAVYAQQDTIKLKEIQVSSNRISLPFSKTSRTIKIITRAELNKASATNLPDLLQEVAGIDIRRRGIDGMQSDLYIRGGNFDQTLVLIDGVKMDDVQTGHHSMNAILPIEFIERIEIIKGPAARVFGQNAFTGAINIITKKVFSNQAQLNLKYGSYNNKKIGTSISRQFSEQNNIFAAVDFQKADGYRFNTDFENINGLIKSKINNWNLLADFTQRKFGANGFYASPQYKDQYEETQTSLVSISKKFISENVTVKPRLYWRRNQDMYVFLRDNPSYYRNLHISNKMGAETNMVIHSNLGKTGIGFDVSRVFLVSNNLNNHNRTMITGFLEHRFEWKNWDVTPGVAISYFSDFNTKAFPGLDIGYQLSTQHKIYGNIGYTYRVPTFTDMFYVGPTTQGNSNLEPESALSEEIGYKFLGESFNFQFALFNRTSDNLIDWTKQNEGDKWQTQNFSKVTTQGFETNINYKFKINNLNQLFTFNYSYINDDIKDVNVAFTRYSLNSLKHQINIGLQSQFLKYLSQTINYRYVQRTDGTSYYIVNAKFLFSANRNWNFSLAANNIFNAEYSETNGVPMPKGNVLAGFEIKF
ncbi:MAG: TonB-dependent receptor [Lutibacter sp.]